MDQARLAALLFVVCHVTACASSDPIEPPMPERAAGLTTPSTFFAAFVGLESKGDGTSVAHQFRGTPSGLYDTVLYAPAFYAGYYDYWSEALVTNASSQEARAVATFRAIGPEPWTTSVEVTLAPRGTTRISASGLPKGSYSLEIRSERIASGSVTSWLGARAGSPDVFSNHLVPAALAGRSLANASFLVRYYDVWNSGHAVMNTSTDPVELQLTVACDDGTQTKQSRMLGPKETLALYAPSFADAESIRCSADNYHAGLLVEVVNGPAAIVGSYQIKRATAPSDTISYVGTTDVEASACSATFPLFDSYTNDRYASGTAAQSLSGHAYDPQSPLDLILFDDGARSTYSLVPGHRADLPVGSAAQVTLASVTAEPSLSGLRERYFAGRLCGAADDRLATLSHTFSESNGAAFGDAGLSDRWSGSEISIPVSLRAGPLDAFQVFNPGDAPLTLRALLHDERGYVLRSEIVTVEANDLGVVLPERDLGFVPQDDFVGSLRLTTVACAAGTDDCDGDGVCETWLAGDAENCSICGLRCASGSCDAGRCTEEPTNNFGRQLRVTTFADANADGLHDGTEAELPGVFVSVEGCAAPGADGCTAWQSIGSGLTRSGGLFVPIGSATVVRVFWTQRGYECSGSSCESAEIFVADEGGAVSLGLHRTVPDARFGVRDSRTVPALFDGQDGHLHPRALDTGYGNLSDPNPPAIQMVATCEHPRDVCPLLAAPEDCPTLKSACMDKETERLLATPEQRSALAKLDDDTIFALSNEVNCEVFEAEADHDGFNPVAASGCIGPRKYARLYASMRHQLKAINPRFQVTIAPLVQASGWVPYPYFEFFGGTGGAPGFVDHYEDQFGTLPEIDVFLLHAYPDTPRATDGLPKADQYKFAPCDSNVGSDTLAATATIDHLRSQMTHYRSVRGAAYAHVPSIVHEWGMLYNCKGPIFECRTPLYNDACLESFNAQVVTWMTSAEAEALGLVAFLYFPGGVIGETPWTLDIDHPYDLKGWDYGQQCEVTWSEEEGKTSILANHKDWPAHSGWLWDFVDGVPQWNPTGAKFVEMAQ